jgi:uncharacterized protein (TIGR03435 family)
VAANARIKHCDRPGGSVSFRNQRRPQPSSSQARVRGGVGEANGPVSYVHRGNQERWSGDDGPKTDHLVRCVLHELLETAYDVKSYQIIGPPWLGCCSDRYTIAAKAPEGATKEQVNLMWQNLLKDRFGVVVHHESRAFQADEMTLAKGASKLKETDLPDSASPLMPGMSLKTGPDGLPQLAAPGWTLIGDGTTRRILGRAQSLADVASILATVAGHPVTDKTGLTGKYDFSAELDLSEPCESCVIANVLERELGLKLVKSTVRLDVIVVDHAKKIPTDN